jgi:hypothetical protein
MKYECELCGSINTKEDMRFIVLTDDITSEVLETLQVCEVCRPQYEYTIGVVEWEEEK